MPNTDNTRPCPDCGVDPGQRHSDGCDVARCSLTGQQELQCDITAKHKMTTWTGEWPGAAECQQFGWYARWTVTSSYSRDGLPDTGPQVACSQNEPGAGPDLNRLATAGYSGELVWDTKLERWTIPTRPALEADQ